jgi:hypothetical protein
MHMRRTLLRTFMSRDGSDADRLGRPLRSPAGRMQPERPIAARGTTPIGVVAKAGAGRAGLGVRWWLRWEVELCKVGQPGAGAGAEPEKQGQA